MCREEAEILGLIIILSTPDALEWRNVVRRTWGSEKNLKKSKFKTIFVLGTGPGVSAESLRIEFNAKKDLLLSSVVESYRNLTIKTFVGLSWAAKFCSNAKHIIKTDHDMVLDLNGLSKLLLAAFSVRKKFHFFPNFLFFGRKKFQNLEKTLKKFHF